MMESSRSQSYCRAVQMIDAAWDQDDDRLARLLTDAIDSAQLLDTMTQLAAAAAMRDDLDRHRFAAMVRALE
jgi:hypothetical protein